MQPMERYRIPSKTKPKSKWQIWKINAKNSYIEILQITLHATHVLELLDKMYKYDIDSASIVEDTEQTGFRPPSVANNTEQIEGISYGPPCSRGDKRLGRSVNPKLDNNTKSAESGDIFHFTYAHWWGSYHVRGGGGGGIHSKFILNWAYVELVWRLRLELGFWLYRQRLSWYLGLGKCGISGKAQFSKKASAIYAYLLLVL